MRTLAEPEALADLSPTDRDAWNEWVRREKTHAFLDRVIAMCRVQAEVNRGNPGQMLSGERHATDQDDA